ncbi:hypothetical protein GCM10009682_11800 [Luedemannella flava]|uniref:RNA polymerase sigma factor 70 region 4 type 2 domain-containing protein n=1 Tax=Luedemannella flava TaxID=349316 RepID=A0ABN2LK59_9ACTN
MAVPGRGELLALAGAPAADRAPVRAESSGRSTGARRAWPGGHPGRAAGRAADVPFAQREALALHYLADLPIEEIATRTGTPVGTVKARLSRGRDALSRLMASDNTATTNSTHTMTMSAAAKGGRHA